MDLTSRDVLVVVPAFNEEKCLLRVVEEVRAAGLAMVVIDDCSSDRTAEIGRRAGVKVISLPINLGVGGALRTGLQFARRRGYEAIVQIDADGQHDPSVVPELISAVNSTEAHLVIGSRFRSDATTMTVGRTRRLVMRLLAKSASLASKSDITDPTSGFRLIREPLLEQLSQSMATNYLGDTYEAIIVAGRAGYRIHEVPASMRERSVGQSTSTPIQSAKFTIKGLGVWALHLHTRIRPLVDQIE